MRKLPSDFIDVIKSQTNTPIDLIAVEVTPCFTSYCRAGTTGQSVSLDPITTQALTDWEADNDIVLNTDIGSCISELGSGAAWVLGCDEGQNAGVNRLITEYSSGAIVFSGQTPYNFVCEGDNPDRVRISKYLFLAVRNEKVNFFVPDVSTNFNQEISY